MEMGEAAWENHVWHLAGDQQWREHGAVWVTEQWFSLLDVPGASVEMRKPGY